MLYSSGEVYEGKWANYWKNGIGKTINPYGAVWEGEFKAGNVARQWVDLL